MKKSTNKNNMFKFRIQSSPTRSTRSGTSTTSSVSANSPQINGSRKVTSTIKATNEKSPPLKVASPQSSFDEADDAPIPDGLVRCSICKRNFAEDRIEKHQVICQKTKTKKRKIYDASKKRVQVRFSY
jgi:hypothetical protein